MIFEFLQNTKEITLKEYYNLNELVNEITEDVHEMQTSICEGVRGNG